MSQKTLYIVWWIVLLFIDQMSKYYFFDKALFQTSSIVEPLLNIGISFSWNLSYLIVVPVTLFALALFIYLNQQRYLSNMGTMLFVVGTLGNLIDRVLYHWVRDFIVMFDRFVYNIADVYITIATIMVLRSLYVLRCSCTK